MKKIIIMLLFVLIITSSCSNASDEISKVPSSIDTTNNNTNNDITNESNNLILYFSYSNNTKRVADYLKDKLQATIVRIIPEVLYTDEDVDYTNSSSRSQLERKNDLRPEISNETYQAYDLSKFDNIFIGHPIWNNYSPMIIKTFIEHEYDALLNKNIYTFSTSASSSGVTAFNDLKNKYSTLNFKDNLHLTSYTLNNMEEVVNNKLSSWNLNSTNRISLSFDNYKIVAEIGDNKPGNDLIERLKANSISLSFNDFNKSEKIAYIKPILDTKDENGYDPKIGDIVIYKPWNNLAIFYKDSVSYSDDLIYVGKVDSKYLDVIASISDNTLINIKLEEN